MKTCFLFTLTLLHSVPCCLCHSKYLPAPVTATKDLLSTYYVQLMSYVLPINYIAQFLHQLLRTSAFVVLL